MKKKKNDWQHFTITTEVYGWIGVGAGDEIRHTLQCTQEITVSQ